MAEAALGTAVEKDAFRVLLEIERRLREEERKIPRSQRGRAHQKLLKIKINPSRDKANKPEDEAFFLPMTCSTAYGGTDRWRTYSGVAKETGVDSVSLSVAFPSTTSILRRYCVRCRARSGAEYRTCPVSGLKTDNGT